MGFMTPSCPECGAEYSAIGTLHWHLRKVHGYAPSDAYDAADKAFEHLSDEWLARKRQEIEEEYGRGTRGVA